MADEKKNVDSNQQNGSNDLQNFQKAVDYAVKEQKKKKRKKRLIVFAVIAAVIILIIAVSSSGNSSDDKKASDDSSVTGTSSEINAESEDTKNNVAGKYNVELKNAKVTQANGKSYLIVTYSYTNNSSKNQSFEYAIVCNAFQNGIELGPVYSSYGIEGFDIQLKRKELQPGKTLDVQEAYELNDAKTKVEIQVGLWADYNKKVYDTFSLNLEK